MTRNNSCLTVKPQRLLWIKHFVIFFISKKYSLHIIFMGNTAIQINQSIETHKQWMFENMYK